MMLPSEVQMTEQQTRRRFVLTTAATSCGALCAGAHLGLAGADGEEIRALRTQLSIDFQTRQAQERAALFGKLIGTYGDQLLDHVKANTIEQTRRRLQDAELKHRDLTGVKENLWSHLGNGFEYTCLVDTSNRLQYKVTRCFLATEMLRHQAGPIGFAFYCAYDYGFCQGLNPKIRFTRTQTLMQGAPCCDHSYELPAE